MNIKLKETLLKKLWGKQDCFEWLVDMIDIDRQLIRSFWSPKIALKKDIEIYYIFFLLI